MSKIITMSLAFSVIEKMLERKRINHSQYIELIDDIKLVLDISEKEYMEALDKSWTDNSNNIDIN